MYGFIKRAAAVLLALLLIWLCTRYLLPLLLPFLLGAGLALAAEPFVAALERRVRFPRAVGSGICVALLFLIAVGTLTVLVTALLRQLGTLGNILDAMARSASAGLSALQSWLLDVSGRAPDTLRPVLQELTQSVFSGGASLFRRAADGALNAAGSVLRKVPDSALTLGTALISGCMLSARLPLLRERIGAMMNRQWLASARAGAEKLKQACLGFLSAQIKLTGYSLLILCAGLCLLRIPYAPMWAGLIALVDAFPILGTGTVLLPWAAICLTQGNVGRALGLAGLYAVTALTRSALEPRLVGRQLGLDPLVTLATLYVLYKLWGLTGALLSPLLSVGLRALLPARAEE